MITVKVDDELHIELKIKMAKEQKTLQDYIVELIKKDLENDKKE